MAWFYPGQRVRRKNEGPNAGLTGTVYSLLRIEPGVPFQHPVTGVLVKQSRFSDIQVFFDAPYWTVLGDQRPANVLAMGRTEQFEPLLPDGLETLDEVQALWEPEPCVADI